MNEKNSLFAVAEMQNCATWDYTERQTSNIRMENILSAESPVQYASLTHEMCRTSWNGKKK